MVIIELRVSDPAELGSLRSHLARLPGLEVVQQSGPPTPGELGVWEFLQVAAASGGVLATAVGTIPEFIRSRRTDVTVKVKRDDVEVEISAANPEDALRLLHETLNG